MSPSSPKPRSNFGSAASDLQTGDAERLLSKLENEQLKEMCKARQLPVRGAKAELVHRLLLSESRATD